MLSDHPDLVERLRAIGYIVMRLPLDEGLLREARWTSFKMWNTSHMHAGRSHWHQGVRFMASWQRRPVSPMMPLKEEMLARGQGWPTLSEEVYAQTRRDYAALIAIEEKVGLGDVTDHRHGSATSSTRMKLVREMLKQPEWEDADRLVYLCWFIGHRACPGGWELPHRGYVRCDCVHHEKPLKKKGTGFIQGAGFTSSDRVRKREVNHEVGIAGTDDDPGVGDPVADPVDLHSGT